MAKKVTVKNICFFDLPYNSQKKIWFAVQLLICRSTFILYHKLEIKKVIENNLKNKPLNFTLVLIETKFVFFNMAENAPVENRWKHQPSFFLNFSNSLKRNFDLMLTFYLKLIWEPTKRLIVLTPELLKIPPAVIKS